jgi:hypothetical protein
VVGLTLTLRPYHTVDNPDYPWTPPISGTSPGACGVCHPMIVAQWITNAHGSAASNPRFFSMYNGTHLSGAPDVAPGYIDDFPATAGHCANCHAPGVGLDNFMSTDMNAVRDQVTATVHCDYCHKVGGVYLNPATDTVYPNMPGAQSQRMLRPPAGDDIFFGPYDDIHDPDTYLPEISESSFCAPCHQFAMWGTPIYESYDEWLASPYATANVTCQDCHMPPIHDGDETFFALPSVGGLPHPWEQVPSHLQLGADSVELLQNTVTVTLSALRGPDNITVTVVITNTGAGHHVPTDYPGRHLILTVEALAGGGPLPLVHGPAVPFWGGEQAGLPGAAFAKLLRDIESGDWPVVNYWKQALIVDDTRIPALGSHRSVYTFAAPTGSDPITVTAELRFRRLFQATLDAKGWDTPDIVMERVQTELH